jgi:hypothetical protein
MVCSIDLSESALARLMNAVSRIMIMCWLSFLPSFAPRGYNSASAAV